MPTPPHGLSDGQLLELLTTALAPEPPDHHVDMLMTGYDLRHADDLVAAMTYDSEVDAMAGVRATATGVRELTFSHGDVTIDVEIQAGGIVGQVLGAEVAEIVLERPDGSQTAAVDGLGRFRVADVGPGAFRVVIAAPDRRIVTAWSTI